jgi:hypothetical protein
MQRDLPSAMQEMLSNFTYKPNFGFTYYQHNDLWNVRIMMYAEDARQPLKMWQLTPHEQRPGYDDYFLDFDARRFRPENRSEGWSPSREQILIQGIFIVPPGLEDDEKNLLRWMIDMFRQVETHEQDEWFRYKGVLVNDPHKEN